MFSFVFHSLNSNELSIIGANVDEVEVKWNHLLFLNHRLDLGWIVISHLEESGGIWESGLGLLGGIVSELLGLLGIDNGSLTISTLLVNVSGGSSGSGNKSWDWWNWWECNSSTLPGDWVLKLNKGRGVWESSLSLCGGIIAELLGLLGIDDSGLSIGTLLVNVRGSSSGSGNEPWHWWNWWESNSSTLPGDWVFSLDESRGIWESSLGLLGGLITELLGFLSINDGSLSIGTLLVNVSSSTSGSGDEPWDWWNWWESNSSTLPGDWVLNLDKAGSDELLWAS